MDCLSLYIWKKHVTSFYKPLAQTAKQTEALVTARLAGPRWAHLSRGRVVVESQACSLAPVA